MKMTPVAAKESAEETGTKLGKMDCFAATHIGRKRSANEDQYLVADLVKSARVQASSLDLPHGSDGGVSDCVQSKWLLVADGMGGHAAGRQASGLVAEQTVHYITNHLSWPSAQDGSSKISDHDSQRLVNGLRDTIKHCQKAVMDAAAWNPQLRGMGTTLTGVLLNWPTIHVAHVGDSRCYVLRDQQLMQLTRDHTYAQALIDSGEMTFDEANQSRFNHTLWNVVGGHDPTVEAEVSVHQLQLGDTLLICTDGLTGAVGDDVIAEVLSASHRSREACHTLIQLANQAGGKDNITAIVARFIDSQSYTPSDDDDDEPLTETSPTLSNNEFDFSLSDSTIQFMND